LTTQPPESQSTKAIIATRPKPEASATRLHIGERVVVALTSFTVLPAQPAKGQLKKTFCLGLLFFALTRLSISASVFKATINSGPTFNLAVPVTKHFDFNILGTLRLGRDISRPVDERVGGIHFQVRESISPCRLTICTSGCSHFAAEDLGESPDAAGNVALQLR
jgi:hypothetical protein